MSKSGRRIAPREIDEREAPILDGENALRSRVSADPAHDVLLPGIAPQKVHADTSPRVRVLRRLEVLGKELPSSACVPSAASLLVGVPACQFSFA